MNWCAMSSYANPHQWYVYAKDRGGVIYWPTYGVDWKSAIYENCDYPWMSERVAMAIAALLNSGGDNGAAITLHDCLSMQEA